MGSFWEWAFSDLCDNTLRGVLAEFLVARALGHTAPRDIWASSDLTFEGAPIEVKAAGYLQTWESRKPRPTFSIAIAEGLTPDGATYDGKRRRHARLYVFCYHKTEQHPAAPWEVTKWTF